MFTKTWFKAAVIVVGVGLLGFVGIQFMPVDRSNPPVISGPQWDSSKTKALMQRACFDCHSNETKWPWYAYVAPVSWLVANDVHEARAVFNVSEWQPGDGAEAAEQVEAGNMPRPQYLLMHPEARLTKEEKEALIAGLKATFGAGGE